MDDAVVKIIEEYLNWERAKQNVGYSDALRLKYDNDAKYFLDKGYSRDEALHADTIVSFWTVYKTLLKRDANWIACRKPKSLESLLRQIRSKRKNDYTADIIKLNEKIEAFANVIYTNGNYMLLPHGKRALNNERYEKFEDRIDLTLYHSFSGGELSHYFENDDSLREWIIREKLEHLFMHHDIKKENIIWLVDNKKKITDMNPIEVYEYLDSAISFIRERSDRYKNNENSNSTEKI